MLNAKEAKGFRDIFIEGWMAGEQFNEVMEKIEAGCRFSILSLKPEYRPGSQIEHKAVLGRYLK